MVPLRVISFTLTVTLRNWCFPCSMDGASQLAQLVKKLPVSTGDTRDPVQSLAWEDPLE